MSTSKQITEPLNVNGVEFYISSDGKDTGISQSGLARLCDVPEQTLRALIESIKNRTVTDPKLATIESYEIYHDHLKSKQQAKILKTSFVSKVIWYYAYDANQTKAIAIQSYDRFVVHGLDRWIQTIAGFDSPEPEPVNATSKAILDQLKAMQKTLEYTEGFRRAVPDLPGLRMMTDGYKETSQKRLKAMSEPLTFTEWLMQCQPEIYEQYGDDLSFKHRLANKIKETYGSMNLGEPEKIQRRGVKKQLKSAVAVYPPEHFSILDTALAATLIEIQNKKPKPPSQGSGKRGRPRKNP